MKYIILIGVLLLSNSLFAMQEPQEIVLHFNDGQQRTLSAELAEYIPLIKDSLAVNENKQEINFTLISSAEWDPLKPFLPLQKQILSTKNEESRSPHNTLPLDQNYKVDNMAHLFLQIRNLKNIGALLPILHVAYFLQIQEIQDIAKINLIERLKNKDEFESFVKNQGKTYYTLPLELQLKIIDSLHYKKSKSLVHKTTGSIGKEDVHSSSYFDLIYSQDESVLLFIKKKRIYAGSHFDMATFYTKPPKINSLDCTESYPFLYHLFFMNLKAEWKSLERRQWRENPSNTEVRSYGRGYPTFVQLQTPQYQVQLCKHTYPHSIYLYNTLKSDDSFLLKSITKIGDCSTCRPDWPSVLVCFCGGLIAGSTFEYVRTTYFTNKFINSYFASS